MLVLHGGWLPATSPGASGQFVVWAETSQARLPRVKGKRSKRAHPFATGPRALQEFLAGFLSLHEPVRTVTFHMVLPAAEGLPVPSPQLVHDWDLSAGRKPSGLQRFAITGLALSPPEALSVLTSLPAPYTLPPSVALGDDLVYWSVAARLALERLIQQQYLPAIEVVDSQGFRARWRPVFDRPEDAARLARLRRAMPPAARAYLPDRWQGEPPDHPWILEDFLTSTVDGAIREWLGKRWRRIQGDEAAVTWLNALFSPDPTVKGPSFALQGLVQAYQAWVRQLSIAGDATFRVCFRLQAPEDPKGRWTLDYFLQATDDPSLLVPAEMVWQSKGKTLTYLNRRFEHPQERLLAALGYVARLFPPVERSLRGGLPEPATLTPEEAYRFLSEVLPLLDHGGFRVLVPPWWNQRGSRLGLRLRVVSPSSPATRTGFLSLDELVNYRWEVVLGDHALTKEEFETLVRLKVPLVQIRGQWVMLSPDQIEAAMRLWNRRQSTATAVDALRLALTGDGEHEGLPLEKVEVSGWLGELVEELRKGERVKELPQPKDFSGTLRPYQRRGFSWLAWMRRYGLGACLADDMGLGKTPTAISLLLHARRETRNMAPALVICPTSVVGNWQRELERFAPRLRVVVHHGMERASGEGFLKQLESSDVVITSYSLARRDAALLAQPRWSILILDEAQNLKNPGAKQTQAVRRIQADFRVALTGTPIENRLSDLWSIFHILNPGYLGSQKAFRTQFALPIERYRDPHATERLRRLVGPFILRRVKTDPAIVQDLPEKLEMKVYCNLTPEQATLYEAVVREALGQIEASEGIRRKGLVLSTLLRLKQVCNHPALFLGDGSPLPGRSGKLNRLTEMLEEILSVGDRALIFTQFATMGDLLRDYLQETFGREVLFLHGGTPRKQREQMIDRFQDRRGPPLFVISLKAGGLGLNLTAANHVFHYDRWWNPAVEQQATDRAFRIGQQRNVQVHKFLCIGTLEENIDRLMEHKRDLAESIVTAGEGWLTELSTEELRKVLALRPEAVGV